MIPTFNDGPYLQKCLQSVLEACPPKSDLEVVVIDDRSTRGNPQQTVASSGDSRVRFLQNEENLGSTGNFNRCIQESRGEFVHILHADDWVERAFYKTMEDAFLKNPEVALVCARVNIVGEGGELLELSPRLEFLEKPSRAEEQLYRENPIRTPGVVVKKSVYEKTGGFHPSLRHSADWELWIRILKKYPGLFLNQPIANYRFFPNNETHRFYQTGENIRDLLRLYNILQEQEHEFPAAEFLVHVYRLTKTQIKRYRLQGERQAALANLSALRELFPHLPLKRKIQALLFMMSQSH